MGGEGVSDKKKEINAFLYLQVISTADSKTNDKKKAAAKLIELPLDVKTHGFTLTKLKSFQLQEVNSFKTNYIKFIWTKKIHLPLSVLIKFYFSGLQLNMIKNDQTEKDRVDVRNALEEYMYNMREKFAEDGMLAAYVADSERQLICKMLNNLETWLYDEGEDIEIEQYYSKMSIFHVVIDPIKARSIEHEQQPIAFNELAHTVQMAIKAVTESPDSCGTEILNLLETAEKTQKWHDEQIGTFHKLSKTEDLPIKYTDIRHQQQSLLACMNSVLNRPKPMPPTLPVDNNEEHDKNEQKPTSNDSMGVE